MDNNNIYNNSQNGNNSPNGNNSNSGNSAYPNGAGNQGVYSSGVSSNGVIYQGMNTGTNNAGTNAANMNSNGAGMGASNMNSNGAGAQGTYTNANNGYNTGNYYNYSNSGNQNPYANQANRYTGGYTYTNATSGTYQQQNSGYYNQAQFTDGKGKKPKKAKTVKVKDLKEKKPAGGFKKVLLGAGCGLAFGAMAGLSFFGIRELGNVIHLTNQTEISTEANATGNSKAGSSSQAAKADAGVAETNSAADADIATTTPVLQTGTATVIATDVTNVVENVMPSIVSIENEYVQNYYYYQTDATASGSGIIIGQNDTELLIVTNYHVIENCDKLTVTFCDDSTATAQVKGTDSSMDLAVIAIPLENLSEDTQSSIKIATIGDSDSLKVGETAIAIGNALGYGQSVTTGVISALNREMDMGSSTGTFIQTDAAINPGNSGGALLNISGEVIGINSNKIGGSTVEGMGYAIPISAAKPILEELMAKETRTVVDEDQQGYLGISGANITEEEQMFYGYPDGIYVANVFDDTAAEEAGLQKGDFITEFDGESVTTMEELQKLLTYYSAGTEVEIVIERPSGNGYEEKTLTVTLGDRLGN